MNQFGRPGSVTNSVNLDLLLYQNKISSPTFIPQSVNTDNCKSLTSASDTSFASLRANQTNEVSIEKNQTILGGSNISKIKKSINELILLQLISEFERNDFNINNAQSGHNIWIMAAAVIPFHENLETSDFLPYNVKGSKIYDPETDEAIRNEYRTQGIPTHIVRTVLRCSFDNGTQQYVDGTDIYVSIDVDKQIANLNIWAEAWVEGPPKFHGGTVPDAINWVRQMAEPFYIQYKDPFLTPEQRIALNGHDDEYQAIEASECKSEFNPQHLNEEEWI